MEPKKKKIHALTHTCIISHPTRRGKKKKEAEKKRRRKLALQNRNDERQLFTDK